MNRSRVVVLNKYGFLNYFIKNKAPIKVYLTDALFLFYYFSNNNSLLQFL